MVPKLYHIQIWSHFALLLYKKRKLSWLLRQLSSVIKNYCYFVCFFKLFAYQYFNHWQVSKSALTICHTVTLQIKTFLNSRIKPGRTDFLCVCQIAGLQPIRQSAYSINWQWVHQLTTIDENRRCVAWTPTNKFRRMICQLLQLLCFM